MGSFDLRLTNNTLSLWRHHRAPWLNGPPQRSTNEGSAPLLTRWLHHNKLPTVCAALAIGQSPTHALETASDHPIPHHPGRPTASTLVHRFYLAYCHLRVHVASQLSLARAAQAFVGI